MSPSVILHFSFTVLELLCPFYRSSKRQIVETKEGGGAGGQQKKRLASSEESFNIELVLTSSTKHQIMKRKVEKKAVPLSEGILETAKRRLSGRAARLELEEQMQTKDALSRGRERESSGPARKKSRRPRPHRAALSTGRIQGQL
jgi:hypothetical protein